VAIISPLFLSIQIMVFRLHITIFQMMSLVVSYRLKKRYSGNLDLSFDAL